jgi:hypothetical protein
MVGVIGHRLASLAQRGFTKAGEAVLLVLPGREAAAYERSLAPEMLDALGRNTHLGAMIGAWVGWQRMSRRRR